MFAHMQIITVVNVFMIKVIVEQDLVIKVHVMDIGINILVNIHQVNVILILFNRDVQIVLIIYHY